MATAPDDDDDLLSRVRARYDSFGRGRVLSHIDELPPDDRRSFLLQLDSIDVGKIRSLLASALEVQSKAKEAVEPFGGDVASTRDVSEGERALGLEEVRRGRVACVLLAGGQGTRLGYDGPKGSYDLGLRSGRTLFRLICERILRLTRLAGDLGGEGRGGVASVPLYIMTSPLNDAETRGHFAENDYFGLPPDDVAFFTQGVLPCLTPDGDLILESPSRVAVAPDGNGGIYPAMLKGGVLDNMGRRGVGHVHVFSVDNALVLPADPSFVGYCCSRDADCGNKVLPKRGAHEKVGVIAERGGRPCVVEYSDLSSAMAERTDGRGGLVFGAGNICQHYYSLSFLRSVVSSPMYHVAHKKIPTWDFNLGRTVKPEFNNGIKLETFIFDVFPMSKRMSCLEVRREDEFAPVKNAPGSSSDTPEEARRMLSDQAGRWMIRAGAILKSKGDKTEGGCEVSPLTSYAGEGLDYEGKDVECPFSV